MTGRRRFIHRPRVAAVGGMVAAALALLAAAPAGAATQIGENFDPSISNCASDLTWLQSTSPENRYAAPTDGVITSWSHQAGSSPPSQLKFKVGRPAGADAFTIVGESGFKSPVANTLNTYSDIRIPVQAGDVIGFYSPDDNWDCADAASGYGFHYQTGDQPPGSTTTYNLEFSRLAVSATLEADTDNDAFGDETQDQCPGVPGPDNGCPPAEPQPEPGPKADGTLTIDANKGKVEKGRKVTLLGQYDTPTNEGCEPNRSIEIQRKPQKAPDSAFESFKSVQTDDSGNYSTKVKVKKTRVYRAVVQENEACDDELSNTQKVRVQKPKAAKEA
jgi:hypothetical protein